MGVYKELEKVRRKIRVSERVHLGGEDEAEKIAGLDVMYLTKDPKKIPIFKRRCCQLLLEEIILLSKELTEISVLMRPIVNGVTITQLAKEALEVYEN